MRIAEKRKCALKQALCNLNKTVGTSMTEINLAVAECEKLMGKRISLEYDDARNEWYYETRSGQDVIIIT